MIWKNYSIFVVSLKCNFHLELKCDLFNRCRCLVFDIFGCCCRDSMQGLMAAFFRLCQLQSTYITARKRQLPTVNRHFFYHHTYRFPSTPHTYICTYIYPPLHFSQWKFLIRWTNCIFTKILQNLIKFQNYNLNFCYYTRWERETGTTKLYTSTAWNVFHCAVPLNTLPLLVLPYLNTADEWGVRYAGRVYEAGIEAGMGGSVGGQEKFPFRKSFIWRWWVQEKWKALRM